MKQFTAGPNEEGQRLSRFVERVTVRLPASLMHKSFRNRRVKVNGRRAAEDYRLAAGDLIELYLKDEFFPAKGPLSSQPAPAPPPALEILYEDGQIALLKKPAGLLCHSDRTGDTTLVDGFVAYLEKKGEYSPAGGSPFRPALCNRLDRGTAGIVAAAKTYAALRDMAGLIRSGLVDKQYRCITKGRPPEGVQTAYLQKEEGPNRVRVFRRPATGRREIRTGVRVLREAGELCLCEVTLYTGRTHQIRAHLAFLGHPLLGDRKYGDPQFNSRYPRQKNQALCAFRLAFAAELPAQNTLHYLAGKSFALEGCGFEGYFP